MNNHPSNRLIYIGNLPPQATKENLIELFSSFGEIVSIRLVPNSNYGFITLSSVESMEKAVASLDDFYYQDHYLILKLVDYPDHPQS